MSKLENRTKPNPLNREAIRTLSQGHVLTAELIGVRAIVEAEQEIIRYIGLDTVGRNGLVFKPKCIRLLHGSYGIKFMHKGTKATMSVVCKHRGHPSHMIDPAATLPRNYLAENLLRDGQYEPDSSVYVNHCQFYGDAVMVEDVRRHWCLGDNKLTANELIGICDDLTTPRRLRGYPSGQVSSILFEEEPNSDDLLLLSMKFL
jgi:hypothetical protein